MTYQCTGTAVVRNRSSEPSFFVFGLTRSAMFNSSQRLHLDINRNYHVIKNVNKDR